MDRNQLTADQVNEFTEYASLVRSIRVENTTELAWKLLSAPNSDDDEDTEDEGGSSSKRRSKSIKSNGDDGESEKSYDSDGSDDSADSTFDSRWPLGPDEVVVPKWHLRDEILGFARAIAPRNSSPGSRARRVPKKTQQRLENDILQPIPDMVKDLLVFVVDLMAVHVPPITDNLQNRIKPVSWEHVLNVLSGSLHGREQGPFTAEWVPIHLLLRESSIDSILLSSMIKDARTRLEELYGPPTTGLRFMDLSVEPDCK